MSTDALALPRTELASRPIVASFTTGLRPLITSAGILYIIYALVFLVIAGSKRPSSEFNLSVRIITLFRPRSSTDCSPCMEPP